MTDRSIRAKVTMDKELWDSFDARAEALRQAYPTEKDCLIAISNAIARLYDLGWRDIDYCPKDGSEFLAVEAGSTGVHPCVYLGEWPEGSWCVRDEEGCTCPSRPILFKKPSAAGGT